ncbi:hypothetical protein [Subtercola endophyticus]|uniref:hypothetical protein n=1 Tax=Subtercola endophyticus TaxID=2895559 RepID=UPI001E4B059B|nr:hypothetical protein [Subtercola endophyticus]UFS58698.1 hypothetical protein LQ955_17135 [Subtercola endophyticus]
MTAFRRIIWCLLAVAVLGLVVRAIASPDPGSVGTFSSLLGALGLVALVVVAAAAGSSIRIASQNRSLEDLKATTRSPFGFVARLRSETYTTIKASRAALKRPIGSSALNVVASEEALEMYWPFRSSPQQHFLSLAWDDIVQISSIRHSLLLPGEIVIFVSDFVEPISLLVVSRSLVRRQSEIDQVVATLKTFVHTH